MIQNERFGTGLKEYLPYAKIIDQSKTSDQYFRLFDVPDKLYVGKNSFRIRVNKDTLVKGSLIYIDVVDSTGEIIFHEITELTGEDGSRLIVVHVYEDTPPGEATIYIGGRASYDVKNRKDLSYSTDPASSTEYIDFPNIIWRGKVVVIPTNENENEIIFTKAPTVKVKERFEEYKTYDTSTNRRMFLSGSLFKISINPIVAAYEFSDTSKSGGKIFENSLQVILDPQISGNIAESRQESIPQYSELPTLYDANGNFIEDYKGGEIIIRDLTQQLNVSGVTVPDFSCSIVEVVDKNNVKIWPAFKFVYGANNESVFKSIKDATNVTASYYTSRAELATNDSESFIQLEFENLEPLAGKVDSVALSYKPFGTFGEFVPIGQFRVRPQEYLVDSSSLVLDKTELIERQIGRPTGSVDFDTYWELIPGKYTGAAGVDESQFADQGVTLKGGSATSSDVLYDFKLKLKDGFGVNTIPNTEFKFEFTLNLPTQASIRSGGDFQLDVFISGSSILRDTINNKDSIELISDLSEGTRIGSLTKKTAGAVTTYTYYFKTISGGKIYPVFVFNNATYLNMKNISIQPRNEFGYSPNQARLFVPLETLKTNTELVLNVEYLTKTGQRAKTTSQVYGLFFTGSGLTPTIVDNGLGGSPVFINVSQSISVQTSGSSLYSTNPATSNFSTNNGIFLGTNAGLNASAADNSNFIGTEAGYGATEAAFSNFIGFLAGTGANDAAGSNFIGKAAGYQAHSASNSNFIGSSAGYQAPQAYFSNFVGTHAGYRATSASLSVFIGHFAGQSATFANDSNFIGYQAGDSAAYSRDSNFIGRWAGQNAYTASSSNFIGYLTGQSAVNANSSNFIGYTAGRYASSSSYSNFIGYKVGYAATNGTSPSRNNIVIGTMISVPYNSQNLINLGGLIFGSGSYFPPTVSGENIFSGSANGKVGINQPNPAYSFDVSGSGNYTNNLYVTGGLLVTQSYLSQVDYIDFNTGSATPTYKSGRLFWDDTHGAVSVYNAEQDITLDVGQVNWTRVRNITGAPITTGTIVRLIGAQGDVPTIEKAQSLAVSGSVNVLNQILGLATHTIEHNSIGYITTQGILTGVDTSAFNAGDTLFISTGSAGQPTNIPPRAPYEVIPIGVCAKASSGGSGIIYVAVQQPIDFSDLSSVIRKGDYAYGDLWVYASSGSFGIWEHSKILSGSYGVSGSLNVSQGITGSIFGSSSYASQALSSSYAITASYVLNSTSFPYTGSAQITGSLSVTGSINVATGSISLPIRVENTVSYYFTGDDYTVVIGGTTPTVYLPTITPGRICIVKNINKVDNVIVSASVSNVIDNADAYTLTPSKSITVQGINASWYIIGTT